MKINLSNFIYTPSFFMAEQYFAVVIEISADLSANKNTFSSVEQLRAIC